MSPVNKLRELSNQVKAETSQPDIYACAASDGEKVRVLLANYNDGQCVPRKVSVSLPGAAGKCTCLITDDSRLNAEEILPVRRGKVTLTLPAYSVVLLEI